LAKIRLLLSRSILSIGDCESLCCVRNDRQKAVRAINKLFGRNLIARLSSRMHMVRDLNYLEREAHRELFVAGLRSYISQKK
jgi:hypothetical protein